MSEDVSVKFGADIGEATSGITQLREILQGLEAPIRGIRNNLGELAEAFAAAFAVEKVSELVEHMAELGEKTERTAAILGISTEEVGKLNAVAALTGTSSEGMAMAMERLQLQLARAKEGTTPAAKALEALGLSAKELIGLPLPEQMGKIADQVSKFADGGNKTAIVLALLGRAGAQMIPVLDQGSKGFEELGNMAVRTGTAMDELTTQRLVTTQHGLIELGTSFVGVGETLVSRFGPAIDGIVGALTDLVEWFNSTLKAGGAFNGLLELLVEAAKALAAALLTVVVSIEMIVQTVDFALRSIRELVTFNLAGLGQDVTDWQNSMTKSAEQWVKRMNALYGSIGHEGAGEKKPAAPELNLGTGAADAAAKEIEGQIKLLEMSLAKQKVLLDQGVAQYRITQQEKFQSLQDYTDDTYNDERELLANELALYAAGTTKYQEVKNKLLQLDEKYETDSLKITGEAIAAQQKQYEALGNAIESSFNGQLRGLLAGTTSWGQAFKTVMGDMVIYFIEQVEKMVVQWAAGQLAQTTASTTGAAARAAADATATASTLPERAGKFLSDITADGAAVFAGIFANMAPLLGPAAAGPAEAGQATVMAQAANVPKLDVGTPMVLRDGLAMLHRNEAVMPASVAGPWREGQGGGGGNVTVHLNLNGGINDGPSLAKFWKQNASLIAKAVARQTSLTPSQR